MKARINRIMILCCGIILAACSESPPVDPVARGDRLHAVCLSCHGTSIYVSDRREIKSLPALRQEVARWGDYYDPAFSQQDIDDVTAYLNKNFYKF